MTTINALQKRLDRLEDRPIIEPDIVEKVLDTLSDGDLELLHEYASLWEAGFDEEQISGIMVDRWSFFQNAVARFKKATIELDHH